MVKRNTGFASVAAGYLFPEIARRRNAYEHAHPDVRVISLGIGNTTEPLSPHIAQAMATYAQALSTPAGYSGYGDECGARALREKIAAVYYRGIVTPEEVFISDGAKCDIARVQTVFGRDVRVAVQDPAYPVYVDGSVLVGAAGKHVDGRYDGIIYLPCTPENGFLPDLSVVPDDSLIYFCSPNNPTGVASTRAELTTLVEYAVAHGCIIIYDAAYALFIRDEQLPKSIFEIPGARSCAIEVNSFSKPAGFTGVRLGWSVVPRELAFADGTPVATDWTRVMTTLFNGASNIAQQGGLAALSETGMRDMHSTIDYYLENACLISDTMRGANFAAAGARVFSTGNAPYVWVAFPGRSSWELFDEILSTCGVVTTPGAGFGRAGEGFLRFSAFGHRDDVAEACRRLARLSL
ncbi:MAG: LL-diaminopimelate aminotransferase [Treponema sp.]|nr:LL-diaminopimelate aminotransferase [Treponema sp.]